MENVGKRETLIAAQTQPPDRVAALVYVVGANVGRGPGTSEIDVLRSWGREILKNVNRVDRMDLQVFGV
jgi:hypothetical protein